MINYQQVLNQQRITSSAFADVVRYCQFLLFNCKEARPTLNYIMGRMSERTIKKFGIGYFPPSQHLHYLLSMLPEETLIELRLMYRNEVFNGGNVDIHHVSFFEHHSLLFPILDERNSVVALSSRTLKSDAEQKELKIQKYKNSQYDKSLYCYGLNHAKESILENDKVIIVEGQVDCCNVHSRGITNCIALTGHSLARYQFNLLLRLTNNFLLLLDNDVAGIRAAEKIIRQYGDICSIKSIHVPDPYKDIDAYLKDHQFNELSEG